MERSTRLAREDWVRAGLQALGKSGSSGLKPDLLAKELGVSRGSFYWHFANVADFHEAVLEAWETSAVDDPWGFASKGNSVLPARALSRLVHHAFGASTAREVAILAWTSEFPPASAAIQRVNQRRTEILVRLFTELGFDPAAARVRAFATNAAYLARIQLGAGASLTRSELRELVKLLIKG